MNNRQKLLWTFVLAAGLVLVQDNLAAQPGVRARADDRKPVDVILHNARIVTLDEANPEARAIAISGNEIVAVGGQGDVNALGGPDTVRIDLEGLAVLPGFVDPHNHVFGTTFAGQHPDQWPETYAESQQLMLSLGITAIGDPFVWPAYIADFVQFAESGALQLRTSLYPLYNTNCGVVLQQNWYHAFPQITSPGERFRVPGIKFYTDGGSCGGWALSIPGDPDAPYEGDLYMTPEQVFAAIGGVQAEGYQAVIHAAGDVAIDTALSGLETLLGGAPNVMRHRIDHNVVVRDDQWSRYGEVGVPPVLFAYGGACFFNNPPVPPSDAGIARRPWFFPTRDILDANPDLPVAWHSDAGHNLGFPLAPIENLWSLVTRAQLADDGSVCEPPAWLAAGAVTIDEALRMATINSAYVLGIDSVVGSLAVGKRADLVVLSDNPRSVPSSAIKDIGVLMTMVDGEVAYCHSDSATLCVSATEIGP